MHVFQQQGNVGLPKMMGVIFRHSKFYEKRDKEIGRTVTLSSVHSFFTGTLELFSCSPWYLNFIQLFTMFVQAFLATAATFVLTFKNRAS
jgi:hypothetical protein